MMRKIELTLTAIIGALFAIPTMVLFVPVYCLARHFNRVMKDNRNVDEVEIEMTALRFVFGPISTFKAIWTGKD